MKTMQKMNGFVWMVVLVIVGAAGQASAMPVEIPAPVPEPGTMILLGIGLLGLLGLKRKFRSR